MLSGKDLGRAIEQAIDKKIASGAVKTKAEIARHFKIKAPSIHDWIKKGSISKDKLPELWNYFSDVVGAEHWGLDHYPNFGVLPDLNEPDSSTYRIEVLDIQASAGRGVMIRDEFVETIKSIEYSESEAKSIFGGRPAENIKMIAVNGDSMSGTFEPRDQIFVDVSCDYFDGDGIYIFTIDDKLYIKRLQQQFQRIAVISDNKKYETWYIDKADENKMRVLAKVLVSQSRSYKFHA